MSRNYQEHPELYPEVARHDPHVVYIKPGFEPDIDWEQMLDEFAEMLEETDACKQALRKTDFDC